METLLIHDLKPKQLSAVLPDTSGYTIIDANRSAAFCQGCFRCWLASPGRCVMKDSLQTVSAQIGNAEAVIVLSRCCFGGFSPGVKRLLDRAIAQSAVFHLSRRACPPSAALSKSPCVSGLLLWRGYGL